MSAYSVQKNDKNLLRNCELMNKVVFKHPHRVYDVIVVNQTTTCETLNNIKGVFFMFMNTIRNHSVVAGILAVLRIYIGYTWFTSGISKLGTGFDASGFIAAAAANTEAVQPWWRAFLQVVALPNAELFSFLVVWGEVLVGLALILGLFTNFAALMGITMNFSFLFSGTVSINAQMAVITIFLIVAGANAGKFGLDRWVMPFIKNQLSKKQKGKKKVAVA